MSDEYGGRCDTIMNMTTHILDGKVISSQIKAELKQEAEAFAKARHRKPGLATILVGDNPASHTYVVNKIKACNEVGMESIHCPLPASTGVGDIVALMKKLNA